MSKKWIIVAGATSSTGKEISTCLLAAGYSVIAVCLDMDEVVNGAIGRFGNCEGWQWSAVDIRRPDKVEEFYDNIAEYEVAAIVNAVRFVPSTLDRQELGETLDTNVLGLFNLVQGLMYSKRDLSSVSLVDIVDEGWHTELLVYRAAMSARRQLAKDLINLCHLRLKTVVRFPNDTPEKIAEFVGDAIFGMFKDVVGELTPSNARMSV